MTRRTHLNLCLLAGAAILGALLWLTRPAPPAPPQPLLDIAQGNVSRIEIQRPGDGGQTVVLERGTGRWRLTAPVSARANAARVRDVLTLTEIVPERRYPAAEIDLTETGLKPPLVRLQFNGQPPVAIGGRGPLDGNGRYLRIGGTVVLADIPNTSALELAWTQWIDPQLIAADAGLEQLRLPGLTLTRAESGGWRVTPARRDRGADAAQRTVDTWRRARALSITPSSDQPPVATVELVFANGRTRRLGVIAREPELVLRDERLGVDYHLAANRGAPLLDMQHPELPRNTGPDTPETSEIPLVPSTNPSENP